MALHSRTASWAETERCWGGWMKERERGARVPLRSAETLSHWGVLGPAARECVRAVTEPRACALPATDHILSARGAVRGAQMSGPPPALGRKKAMGEAEKQATLKVRA